MVIQQKPSVIQTLNKRIDDIILSMQTLTEENHSKE